MAEERICDDCGCVFSTAGYENPGATTHEHWQGCIDALQAELADSGERADAAASAIDVVLTRLPVPDNDNRKRLRVARDLLRGAPQEPDCIVLTIEEPETHNT